MTLGLLCLVWPYVVQRAALKIYGDDRRSGRRRVLVEFMGSSAYILMLRLFGFVWTALAIFLIAIVLSAVVMPGFAVLGCGGLNGDHIDVVTATSDSLT